MQPFRYYTEGARPQRALRPEKGASFFTKSKAEGYALPAGLALVGPDDPRLYYVGRFDPSSAARPVFVWQGSQLLARFTGRRIGFRFESSSGPNFFNVIVDGDNRLLALEPGTRADYVADFALGPGEHELVLYKRSEGYFGSAALLGLLIEESASLGPKPEELPLRIEFYGDSITAGACDDDPGEDQYDDLSTHDNYLSYGALACRELRAEYVSIAVSGTGLTCSWNPILMPEVWDRVVPDPESAKWDFSGRRPDLVVVALGQNDVGFPASTGALLSADFADSYISFIRSIRGAYPESRIICAIGGMSAYRDSAELRESWARAIGELRSGDEGIDELRFEAFSCKHPRLDVHRELASELASFVGARGR